MTTNNKIPYRHLAMLTILLMVMASCDKNTSFDEHGPVFWPASAVWTDEWLKVTTTLEQRPSYAEVVLSRGVCWSTSENLIDGKYIYDSAAGYGTYTCVIRGLKPATEYYICPFALTSNGLYYGSIRTISHSCYQK